MQENLKLPCRNLSDTNLDTANQSKMTSLPGKHLIRFPDVECSILENLLCTYRTKVSKKKKYNILCAFSFTSSYQELE